MKFGEMLVKEGVITREDLKLALERQVVFGGRIGTNLVELGILTEGDLTNYLGKYLRIRPADVEDLAGIPEDVIESLSPEIAKQYSVVPFRKERNRLHVAMSDVRNISMIDELSFKTGYDIVPYVVSEIRLLYALEKYYGFKRDTRFISVFDGLDAGVREKDESAAVRKVKEEFINVKDRGEVAGIMIREAKKVATRTALFMVKGEKVEGWVGKGLQVDDFTANIEPSSTIAEVLARRNYYRGPLLDIPANRALIDLVGGTPQDCLIMPIGIRERIVALLYADNGHASVLSANLNYLNSLAAMAALAFEILILQKRIMDL